MRLRVRAILIVLGLPVTTAAAQQVPTLGKPTWTSSESFTGVGAVRELTDGRVIVADASTRELALLSATGKQQRQIARRGAGPKEFEAPVGLLALGGDSTLVADGDQRRFLLLGPDAEPARTISFPVAAKEAPADAQGVDARGRVYFPAALLRPPGKSRMTEVLRWDRVTNRIDTVAQIAGRVTNTLKYKVEEFDIVANRAMPFGEGDAWGLAPNGAIGIARVTDYSIDWIGPGAARSRTAPVTTVRARVTDADRAKYLTKNEMLNKALIFPDVKPPFNAQLSLMSPSGEFWLPRYGVADEKEHTWDVVIAGSAPRSVRIPATSRVIGFGRGAVYVLRRDDDDQQWIERYDWTSR
jgi:hypothetical protein